MADRGINTGGLVSTFGQVGRYFQVVSVVPAAVLVLSTYALVAGGAPAQRPSWTGMSAGIGALSLGGSSLLALIVIVVGMTMHPFQFAATQFLEGYWGPSDVGRVAMFSRAQIHAQRRLRFLAGLAQATQDAQAADALAHQEDGTVAVEMVRSMETQLLRASLEYTAFEAAADRYPEEGDRLMPTRLGNVLRRHEDLAGRHYSLEALDAVPRLMAIAPTEQVAHVNDARSDLDLAVRFVVAWLLVAVVTFVLLWPYGPWLLIPIAAYALAWISYRGAVHAADEYGCSLHVLVDVNHDLLISAEPKLIVVTGRSGGRRDL